MEIIQAKYTGFCFGVRKALEKVHQSLKDYRRRKLFMLGEIVHNEEVVNDLKKEGLNLASSLKEVPPGSILILKAHGTEKDLYKKAKKKNIELIDTTCPMVKDIHKKALSLQRKGYKIIIFGEKNHDEIKALTSYLKNFIVIEKIPELKKANLSGKIALLLQSTQDLKISLRLFKELKRINEKALFVNTICRDTQLRQKEVIELSKNNDKVIVVGSKKSANTKRLYNISRRFNKNTYWIDKVNSLEKKDFKKKDKVAIISGASTPRETVEKIIEKLRNLYPN